MTTETALPDTHRVTVFSLESGRNVLERVCGQLGIEPGAHEERTFEDGEHKLRPLESVRGRDVYVVQSLYGDDELSVDDKIVRTLFFAGAVQDAGAERITLVTPYLSYARKDRRTKLRDPVSLRYLATVIEAVGVDRIVTLDVHNPAAFENAFRIPTVHLQGAPLFVRALRPELEGEDVVVVSPDAGGVKRAELFRQVLERQLERSVELVFIEKFRSEGVVWGGAVVGDVASRVAVIVDDLVSSGTTLVGAATACREGGATDVYAAATHGVFSTRANGILNESDLNRLFVLDTIPQSQADDTRRHPNVQVLDSAPLLARAIHQLHTNQSLDALVDV